MNICRICECACMYVYVHVCMYMCMYVCMYMCMNVCATFHFTCNYVSLSGCEFYIWISAASKSLYIFIECYELLITSIYSLVLSKIPWSFTLQAFVHLAFIADSSWNAHRVSRIIWVLEHTPRCVLFAIYLVKYANAYERPSFWLYYIISWNTRVI